MTLHGVIAQMILDNKKHLQYNYCDKAFWGGIPRMKNHLATTYSNDVPCEQVPEENKKQFLKMLQKKRADVGLFRPPKVEVTSESRSGNVNIKKGSGFVCAEGIGEEDKADSHQ